MHVFDTGNGMYHLAALPYYILSTKKKKKKAKELVYFEHDISFNARFSDSSTEKNIMFWGIATAEISKKKRA